jgi:DNA-binding FrmR family transcriptional regulator
VPFFRRGDSWPAAKRRYQLERVARSRKILGQFETLVRALDSDRWTHEDQTRLKRIERDVRRLIDDAQADAITAALKGEDDATLVVRARDPRAA